MGEPLHVLVYGSVDAGPCDSIRLGVFHDLLSEQGIELKTWGELNDYRVQLPPDYENRLDDAVRDGVAVIDISPIDWADVLVFRRWYGTVHACEVCDFAAPDAVDLQKHADATGHAMVSRDRIIRPLLTAIENDPAVLRGRAMVYELDDDLMSPQPWLGFYNRMQGDLDLIERFARLADLVTVSTPTVAASLGRYNSAVRVIRNAVVTDWYSAAAVETEPRPLSLLFYGVGARLREYGLCRDAVDEVAAVHGGRRIWLGSDEAAVKGVVDQVHPYVGEVRGFVRQLVELRPAIGVAPAGQDPFSRGHSELHWLEYSLAGAATVASRTMGGGPYDVIRDGVDGLLARNKAQWREQLSRLAGSRTLREELAGRARERVLAEYDVRQRVVEWADAFRWAADHAGRGFAHLSHRGPARAQVEEREEAAASQAGANLAHRRLARSRSRQEADALAVLRGAGDVCWPVGADLDPLVSVVMTTLGSGCAVSDRSLASVLDQTHRNIEIVIVGDAATPETPEAVRRLDDPRVRYQRIAAGGPYPADPAAALACARSRAFNRGVELARGAWIAPNVDDDFFIPDHVEALLAAALENRLELVYGDSWMETPLGPWVRLGDWPPRLEGFCTGAALYSSGLRFIAEDEESWREGEPNDWNMWKRMLAAGARAGHIEQVVSRHYLGAARDDQAFSAAS